MEDRQNIFLLPLKAYILLLVCLVSNKPFFLCVVGQTPPRSFFYVAQGDSAVNWQAEPFKWIDIIQHGLSVCVCLCVCVNLCVYFLFAFGKRVQRRTQYIRN